MAEKLYDMVVVTGQYRNSSGETRNQYKSIGAVFRGDRGMFFTLDATFNPAGIHRDANRDSIIGNLYEPRQPNQGAGNAPASAPPGAAADDSDIPF